SAASGAAAAAPPQEAAGSADEGRKVKSAKIRGSAGIAATAGSPAAPADTAVTAGTTAPPLEAVPTSRTPPTASWLAGGLPEASPAAPPAKLEVGSEATNRPPLPRPAAAPAAMAPVAASAGAPRGGQIGGSGLPIKSPPLGPPPRQSAASPAASPPDSAPCAASPWSNFRPGVAASSEGAGPPQQKPLPPRRPSGMGAFSPSHPPPPEGLLGARGQGIRDLSAGSAATIAARLQYERAVREDEALGERERAMAERQLAGQRALEQRNCGQEGPDGEIVPLGEVSWANRALCAATEQCRPPATAIPRWVASYDERSCGFKIHVGDLPPDSQSGDMWRWLCADTRISEATRQAITDIRVSARASSGAAQAFLTFGSERAACQAFSALWDWWTPVPHQIQPRGWQW
ncbi:MAG: hypothetical protein GY772_20560, partial [bacterium]|nr:hypothetical protein [bacterium]